MKRYAATKSKADNAKIKNYVEVVRWYIDNTCCLYPGWTPSSSAENCRCASKKVNIGATVGADKATYYFMYFFCNVDRAEVGLYESRVPDSDEESKDVDGDNLDCPEQDTRT